MSIGCALAVAACGGVPPTTGASLTAVRTSAKAKTPVQAALAWFVAINHKDKREAFAAFVPGDVQQMEWGGGKPSTWPTFRSVKCKPESPSGAQAAVYCTFSESQASSVGNPDKFWSIDFRRRSGRWLITSYGQP